MLIGHTIVVVRQNKSIQSTQYHNIFVAICSLNIDKGGISIRSQKHVKRIESYKAHSKH